MAKYPSDIAFTPTVKKLQEAKGSRQAYQNMEERGGWQTTVTPELEKFLAGLDMFYLGTANAEGQPYIQYRGGPTGFLRVVDSKTLGFTDFGGNRQFISLGNLEDNAQAFLFLMDYENRRRVKVWGRAKVVEGDARLNAALSDPAYSAQVERAILLEVAAWDINCPQHIHARVRTDHVEPVIAALQERIAELEAKLAD